MSDLAHSRVTPISRAGNASINGHDNTENCLTISRLKYDLRNSEAYIEVTEEKRREVSGSYLLSNCTSTVLVRNQEITIGRQQRDSDTMDTIASRLAHMLQALQTHVHSLHDIFVGLQRA